MKTGRELTRDIINFSGTNLFTLQHINIVESKESNLSNETCNWMLSNWAGKSDSEIEIDNFVFFALGWPKIESPNYGKYSLGCP